MALIQKIKKAKEIGKLLRKARLSQGFSLTKLAHETEMPIAYLLALENANFNTFLNNPAEMYERASTYAQVLGIDTNILASTHQLGASVNFGSDIFIPHFLRKKE